MVELHLEADIGATAEEVFGLIVDFGGYGRWLPTSGVFEGMVDISADPIALGTTWTEHGPNGVRHGTVTRFEPPTQVTFHQPMALRPGLLGTIDITVALTLTPSAASVHVERLVTIVVPWQLKLAQPLVVRQFRGEGGRTLAALKAFAERPR